MEREFARSAQASISVFAQCQESCIAQRIYRGNVESVHVRLI